MILTRVVWMLLQLLQPLVSDEDALLLWLILLNAKPFAMSLTDDIAHILLFHSTEDTEEEVSLRHLIRELLLGWQVFLEDWILHRILVQILDRDLCIVG
jgi:hypothetical protein